MSNFIAGHEIDIQDTGAPRGERNYWRVMLNGQSLYEGHNGAQARRTYRAVSEGLKRAAPPAAAHGDEAPRPSLWAELDDVGFVIDHTQDRDLAQEWVDSGRLVTAYAAVRAQGDGEVE